MWLKLPWMKIKLRTFLNVLLILFVLSFFVTPLGDYSKERLNELFAAEPTIIPVENRARLKDYDWKLKDAQWHIFDFDKARGKVVFINFWATWHLPSRVQLEDVQKLYDRYQGKMEFYVITNQERELPEEFMARKGFTFPITYLIVGERAPMEIMPPPGSYLIDKKGDIVVQQRAIADWDNNQIYQLLDRLTTE